MGITITSVSCPYCGHEQAAGHWEGVSRYLCDNPKCGQYFAIEVRPIVVAVPFTPDEAAVMWACQGMGYEAGFNAVELAIAKDLLEREFLFETDEGMLDRTPLGDECLSAQSG